MPVKKERPLAPKEARTCTYGDHLGPTRLRHDRLHGAPLQAWICERCGKDITDEVNLSKTAKKENA